LQLDEGGWSSCDWSWVKRKEMKCGGGSGEEWKAREREKRILKIFVGGCWKYLEGSNVNREMRRFLGSSWKSWEGMKGVPM